MICNIVDRRTNTYRWAKITAIVEPTWHDNSCVNADQALVGEAEGIGYDEYPETTLKQAMERAAALSYDVTVYLYDLGEGINISEKG